MLEASCGCIYYSNPFESKTTGAASCKPNALLGC